MTCCDKAPDPLRAEVERLADQWRQTSLAGGAADEHPPLLLYSAAASRLRALLSGQATEGQPESQ